MRWTNDTTLPSRGQWLRPRWASRVNAREERQWVKPRPLLLAPVFFLPLAAEMPPHWPIPDAPPVQPTHSFMTVSVVASDMTRAEIDLPQPATIQAGSNHRSAAPS
jgi:hypothetical protein